MDMPMTEPASLALADRPNLFARSARAEPPLPPAVILGGGTNALSVARSLARAGVHVYVINHVSEPVCRSRYATRIAVPHEPGGADEAWTRYLLGPESDWLRGGVVLACSDNALEILANNHDALGRRFCLDEMSPPAQLAMLDKLATIQHAVKAGVPTPRFWVAGSPEQVLRLKAELVYPLLVKPLLSHVYQQRFSKKFAVAHNFAQLVDAYAKVSAAGIDAMLVEMIPGPDDRLCSYYTYLDEQGNALFDFTKRVIRRYPVGMGIGCYHVTDWIPELRAPALKLFRQVGLRGLANVEFKWDERDGQHKLIECNARFTAANCLLTGSGYDLALFTYNRIVGRPQQPFGSYRLGKRLWYPLEDFHAFRQLRRQGELNLGRWLAGLCHPRMLPLFRWDDPLPSLVHGWRWLKEAVGRRLRRLWSS
jgi:D-aspartate ligase